MKHLRLCEILLLSEKEQKARRIQFHPQATVLTGDNGTGKSSVIKAIYQTLGAVPAKLSSEWTAANVTSLLQVEIVGVTLYFLKRLHTFAVFDENGNLLHTFTSVTKGLGPYFASLVDFQIALVTKENEEIIPPPAFFLLPFYIDQDKSWESSWAGFKNLGFIKDYRKNMAEYHTGIRPNKFYELSAKRTALKTSIGETEAESKVVKGVVARLRGQLSNSEFDMDVGAFEAEIDRLVQESQALLILENELKSQLSSLGDYRNQLLNQRQLIQTALSELLADYEFAAHSPAHIECPTCGQEYDNSFIERFDLAKDQDRLAEFLTDIEGDLSKVDADIAKARQQFKENAYSVATIAELLNTNKQEVTLRTATLNVGRREAADEFQQTINSHGEILGGLWVELSEIEKELKLLEDKKRKKEIVSFYATVLNEFLVRLNVPNVSGAVYKAVTADVAKIGSEKPRALLAYFFAILHTVHKYSQAAFCPITIDSPQQQEQDKNNLKAMLELIRDRQPEQSQLLLGVVDDMGVDFGGTKIELKEKGSVLSKSEYKGVQELMEPFLKKILQASLKPLESPTN